ncbi:hypothetical protein Pmi06nite_79260 [Planotetraspora mira]|uniref:Uncharacterized protein n=1 Tax=Planotetraspora mira TaxID=58121 RepID=A0A8J3U1T6_9ACTN|nr:hypothetical protein Pmi06nite_79260 [Planotetraspora mira]
MVLSRIARELAAEIAQHDWSDAPYQADGAAIATCGNIRQKTAGN